MLREADPEDVNTQCAREMVKVKINNESSLGSRLEHELSGKTFQTDAPVNSNGKLGGFFMADLCAFTLSSCIATIIGMQMQTLGLDLSGMRIKMQKKMIANLPQRIVKLTIDMWLSIKQYNNCKSFFIKEL